MLIQQNMRSAAFAEIPNPYMPGTDRAKNTINTAMHIPERISAKETFARPEAVSLISAG